MPVFRVDKKTNYTRVGNYFIRDTNLSLRGKGMQILLLSLPKDWQYSISGLSAITKEGESVVRSTLDELERLGYLERRRRRDESGMLRGMEYIIYEQPRGTFDLRTGESYLEKPTPENPTTRIPMLDNPVVEKPGQLITD